MTAATTAEEKNSEELAENFLRRQKKPIGIGLGRKSISIKEEKTL